MPRQDSRTDSCGVDAVGERRRSGGALVAVVESADLVDRDDAPGWNRQYLTAATGAVVAETLVRPHDVVVVAVRAKQATQVAFVEHDDEIEAFSTDRPDDALGKEILPGARGAMRTWRMAIRSTRRWKPAP
jgi:hypothetical protein